MASRGQTLAPVALVARANLRRRWRTVVAVGLLFGLAAGIGLACLGGARRTASVFQRHLVASDAAEIEIDPGNVTPEADRALRSLPHVTGAHYWVTYSAFALKRSGVVDQRLLQALVFTTDGRYVVDDRVVTTSGRRLDPTKADEVMVNQSYADAAHVRVGSTLELATVPVDEDGVPLSFAPPKAHWTVRVVGIMVLNEEIISESIDTIPRMFVSPAARRMPVGDPRYYGFAWYGLQVEGGPRAVDEVQRGWLRLADAHNAKVAAGPDGVEGWLTYAHRTSDLQRKADRASRPLVSTLGAFGVLVLLAGVALVAQSLGREVRSRRSDAVTTRVLGLTPVQAIMASLAVPLAGLGLAVVTAGAAAVALSALFPVGPFAVLEPTPGIDVDAALLAPGLVLVFLVPFLLVAVTAWREVHRSALAGGETVRRVGRLVGYAGRTGRSPSVAAAMRLTFDPGTGRSFVPTRSMLASITITILALVTVLEFGGNLRALDQQPARFGWRADAIIASDGGYGPFDEAKIAKVIAGRPEITSYRYVAVGLARMQGRRISSAVFGPGQADAVPVMLRGRSPDRAGEVVLGAATLRSLGTDVGQRITVGEGRYRRRMLVTGTAVFPVLGPVLAERTTLDEGAWLNIHDYHQLDSIASFISYGLPDAPHYTLVMLNLAPGASRAKLRRALETSGASLGSSIDFFGVIRPSEVRTAADGGGRTQLLLSVLLAAVAGLSTLLALAAVVRRRRAELAMYRVLGFQPRQVRATLLWQGLIMSTVGVVIGVPLGIVVGRSLWRAFATRLGVVPDPMIPAGVIAAAALAAVAIGLLGALGPAIAAARVAPAVGVRAE